jgi:tRNA isopentenyl-2-thiomethyl-A-37 hydroxylase MiaE
MNIAAFITARLDERMTELRALEDAHCQGFEVSTRSGAAAFSTRTEMADIQTKRRIVEECCENWDEDAWERDRARASDLAFDVLRLLATLWMGHPDFDPAWRVDV